MRYLENKERSTEILRLALPLMARQLAAFHPLSYALWYEHCAGINPDLSRVLDARLTSNSALTEADVWRLYAQHIAARDMEAFERLQLQLRNLLEDTAQSAASASNQAAEFGHSLEGQHIGLSTECYIVRHADHTWWHVAGALGLLKPETLINVGSMMRPRDLGAMEKATKVA